LLSQAVLRTVARAILAALCDTTPTAIAAE
jgi:hypothetical protein